MLLAASWLLLGSTALADERPLPASACPRLFGSPAAHEENEDFRQKRLDSVCEADYTINLTHCSDWEQPERISFKGLELVETRPGKRPGQVAVVRVDEIAQDVNCDPGLYRLAVDDSIGMHGSVLAVLNDVVLVARGTELHYFQIADSQAPVFRMIWRAPWKRLVLPFRTSGPVTAKRSPAGRTHPRKTGSNRRRGRR